MIKINELAPKVLQVFYNWVRQKPHDVFEKNTAFSLIKDKVKEISMNDFDASILYLEDKELIELSKFYGFNWFGRITAKGIDQIESDAMNSLEGSVNGD